MNIRPFAFFMVVALGWAGLGEALAASQSVPVAPLAAPASRVPQALKAAMLSTARAGERLVAVGDRGVVLLSDDGGQTQRQARLVPVDVTLTSVSFANDKQGWAVGHWGTILKTSDGGETWTQQRSDTKEDRPLFAVHFFDADHGVAVGLWSLVLVTSDGGAHWRTVSMPVPEGAKKADLNLLGLFADSRGRIFSPAEKGMVLRSDDRGEHWTYLATGYKGSFWTGIATPEGALIAAGLRGSLYRSADDGSTWQRLDTHSKSSITAFAMSGQTLIGVGLDGLVLRSSDAGASFTSEVRPDVAPLTAVAFNSQGRPVLYSRQGPVEFAESAGAAK